MQDLATPEAFARSPSLVWEFYHYRREVMLSKQPNAVSYQFKFVTLLSTANVNNPLCYQW